VTDVKFDSNGLVAAIAQDRCTGEIRMLAWMNAEALTRTRETGLATFYSRSRQALWIKGETTGHRLRVAQIKVDCDGDTLLLLVDPEGPSCHTGRDNCFFEELGDTPETPAREALPYLFELERVIGERRAATAERSYTKSLFDAGAERVNAKITEEAGELVRAIEGESSERVASEAADVLYHVLVGLRLREVPLREVVASLLARAQKSGHEEKTSRGK
jgi:phosphoribosyl-AMP cyclohydrolase / phosphoribosyl-ATP pyrophosphohydrolase